MKTPEAPAYLSIKENEISVREGIIKSDRSNQGPNDLGGQIKILNFKCDGMVLKGF